MKLKTILFIPLVLSSLVSTAQEAPSKTEEEPYYSRPVKTNRILAHKPDTVVKEVSLLFIGDVMGHGSQIKGAYYDSFYDYKPVFKYIKPLIESADIAVANLELTHAGPPYQGYPQFSSPDSLSSALKWAGVDMLVTANNHSCDRRKLGVERTITVLNKYDIPHTGTYRNKAERDSMTPLVMVKNDISIGFLNYTYGTNGLPATPPNIVNLIDKEQIKEDIAKAKAMKLDAIIVITHWGIEYQMTANQEQRDIAKFCFEQGATMVIGGHPHVVQEFERYNFPDSAGREVFVCYSLGNFVSNQNDIKSRGGAMARVTLKKTITATDTTTVIGETNYSLIFVHKPIEQGVKRFYVVDPFTFTENVYKTEGATSINITPLMDDTAFFKTKAEREEVKEFVDIYHKHLEKVNENVTEMPRSSSEGCCDNYDEFRAGIKSDSIYHIIIPIGQNNKLNESKLCKEVLARMDWSQKNDMQQLTLGPFTTRKETEEFIYNYSKDCLEGYAISISTKAKP